MKKAKQNMPLNDWIELGKTCKQLRSTIMEIMGNPELQSRMTKQEMGGLWKMYYGIDNFRSCAEEVMYREYKDQFKDRSEWMHIFYGKED